MIAIRTLLLGAALFATSAMAQFGAPGMPSSEYNPILLMDPNVQKDMGISPAVMSKLQNDIMGMAPSAMGALGAMRGKGSGNADKSAQNLLASYMKLQDKALSYLTPKQKARLREITFQVMGPQALSNPKVASQVGLSAKQQTVLSQKYMAVAIAGAQSMRSSGKGLDTSNANSLMYTATSMQKKMKAGYVAAMNAVLTPTQKQKWVKLQGKHVELGMIGKMFSGGG